MADGITRLSGTPNLASIVTSGSYNDLVDIPASLTTSEVTDMMNSINSIFA